MSNKLTQGKNRKKEKEKKRSDIMEYIYMVRAV